MTTSEQHESIEELLGIDPNDPLQKLAMALTRADRTLLADLVTARKAAGLTQAEVAERIGTTAHQVAALEAVDSDPRLSTLRRYALAVEANVTHLVNP